MNAAMDLVDEEQVPPHGEKRGGSSPVDESGDGKRQKPDETISDDDFTMLQKQWEEKAAPEVRLHRGLPIPGLDMASKATPGGRPLAEPPIFCYDGFLPSDLRFQLIFPDRKDIDKLTIFKDAWTEYQTLSTYCLWVEDVEMEAQDDTVRAFYATLKESIYEERKESEDIWTKMVITDDLDESKEFAWWEFNHLDDDLGTKKIEKHLATSRDKIFEYTGGRVGIMARMKYEHLFPDGVDDNYRFYHRGQIESNTKGIRWRTKRREPGP